MDSLYNYPICDGEPEGIQRKENRLFKKCQKKWEIVLSKDSWKYLNKLEKRSPRRILDALGELSEKENPIFHKDVRPLTGKLKESYRLRIGDLRVIFEIDWTEKRIGILAIVPRGNAY